MTVFVFVVIIITGIGSVKKEKICIGICAWIQLPALLVAVHCLLIRYPPPRQYQASRKKEFLGLKIEIEKSVVKKDLDDKQI
jgi:hypothetical protein